MQTPPALASLSLGANAPAAMVYLSVFATVTR
jgi:hypothetical protein